MQQRFPLGKIWLFYPSPVAPPAEKPDVLPQNRSMLNGSIFGIEGSVKGSLKVYQRGGAIVYHRV